MNRSLQGRGEKEEHFMQGKEHEQRQKVDKKSLEDSGHREEFSVVRIWGRNEETLVWKSRMGPACDKPCLFYE